MKATRGLQIECDLDLLSLLCSGGMVPNQPFADNAWTLGNFVKFNGGTANRSKKVWGIYIPVGADDLSYGMKSQSAVDSVRKFVS